MLTQNCTHLRWIILHSEEYILKSHLEDKTPTQRQPSFRQRNLWVFWSVARNHRPYLCSHSCAHRFIRLPFWSRITYTIMCMSLNKICGSLPRHVLKAVIGHLHPGRLECSEFRFLTIVAKEFCSTMFRNVISELIKRHGGTSSRFALYCPMFCHLCIMVAE